MWAVIRLCGGQEDNTFYRRSPGGLTVAGRTSDAVVLGPLVIYAVSNPLKRLTGAVERPCDVERARRVFAEANERWRAEATRIERPA